SFGSGSRESWCMDPQPLVRQYSQRITKNTDIYPQTEQTQIDIHVQKLLPKPLNKNVVTTHFHVIIPQSIAKKYKIYVIGNIEELGMSKKGIIQLKQSKKNLIYWYSDPVIIPLSAFQQENIHYSYHIYKGAETGIKKRLKWISNRRSQNEDENPDVITGDWTFEETEHKLISKENQYDIWRCNNISNMRLMVFQEDYPFLFIIYNSITFNNLKDKIIEYQDINKRHSAILNNKMTIRFLCTCLNDHSTVEQRIFLFVLLSYIMNENEVFKLSIDFPSVKLLEAFNGVNENHLPHDVIILLAPVVSTLAQHASTYCTKFEWMRAFKIAPFADPNYTFLEKIKKPVYTKDNVYDFQQYLYKIVKPCIDNISEEREMTYVNICKALIKLCKDLGVVAFLWQKIFRPSVKLDDEFNQYLLECISNFIAMDNAKELNKHLEEIPIDMDINFAPIFRDRVLILLRSTGIPWNKYNQDAIFNLLHNVRLKWQKASVLQAFEYISISQNPDLLQVFSIQFSSFLKGGLMDEKVGKICAQWFKSILSYIKKLFEIAEREIKSLSDDVIFSAATDAGKLKQIKVVEFFCRILKEKFGPDVRNIDEVVFHIMTRLHENLPETEKNDINFIKALLASSSFWIYILLATGSTERLHRQHAYVKMVRQAIIKLVSNLRNMSIEIGLLKEILNYDDDRLLNFFATIGNDNVSLMIDITVLQSLRDNYKEYLGKLKNLEIFYTRFCIDIVDVQNYIDDIKSKLNLQEK
ncbi:4033_t:CDS:2, partial [Dentiscutata erythropus]